MLHHLEVVHISSPVKETGKLFFFSFCYCFLYYHRPLFFMSKSNEFSRSSLEKNLSWSLLICFIASIHSALVYREVINFTGGYILNLASALSLHKHETFYCFLLFIYLFILSVQHHASSSVLHPNKAKVESY